MLEDNKLNCDFWKSGLEYLEQLDIIVKKDPYNTHVLLYLNILHFNYFEKFEFIYKMFCEGLEINII